MRSVRVPPFRITQQKNAGRFGNTETELAGTVLFLLNNEAAGFITEICIPVDGGFAAYSGV